MNQFASNISVLRRWAALSDQPLPSNFQSFREQNVSAAFEIQQKDPELCTLLSGEAPAGLVADVLSGNWPEVAPTIEERQKEAGEAELQRLYDAKPWSGLDANGKPIEPSITDQLKLAALSPELAERSRAESHNAAAAETAQIRDAADEQRLRRESHQHGMRVAQAQYRRRY